MGRFLSWAVSIISLLVLGVACAGMLSRTVPAEQLFLALQIEDGGRVVARPQLVGESGKRLRLQLVEPARPDQPRLELEMVPEHENEGYRVQLRLAMPDRAQPLEGELALGHGEERKLELSNPVRPLHVKLMLMRVASPEFETWLRLARKALPATS